MDSSINPLRQIEQILAISQTLISTASLEQILHNIVHAATELTDCETAAIFLLDEHSNDTLRFVAVALDEDRLFDIPVPIDASIAGAAFTCEQPVIANDARSDPRYYARVGDAIGYHARSLLAVPLKFQYHKIGVLEAENKKGDRKFDAGDARVLTALAAHAAIAIENARLYRQARQEITARVKIAEELRQQRDHLEEIVAERTAELQQLAITDPLTGTFNRRHLFILGEQLLEHARRYQRPFAVMMIDIDHFKQINDRYGHTLGDQVLKRLIEYLRGALRAADIVGRYGGEEFLVLMPEADLATTRRTAERLCAGIRALKVKTPHDEIRFTVSIGVAAFYPTHAATIDALIQRADQAMYAAKEAGRDQACAW